MTRFLVQHTGPNRKARAAIRAEERKLRRSAAFTSLHAHGAVAASLYRLRKLGIAAHVEGVER